MIYINTTGKQNQVWLPKPYDIVISDCPGAEDAYNSGYTSGHTDGVEDGYDSGYTSGYTDGQASVDCTDFYNSGVTDGYGSGYTSGYTDGLNACSGGSCEGIWEEGYDSGYTDGQSSVDCTDFYNSGKTDGAAEQKAKMTELNVDNADLHVAPGGVLENDFYREDGWNHVWVAVDTTNWWDSGYTSGYTDGVNACSGGSYQEGYDDGWDAGYSSGKTDGIAEQKAKLASTAFTINGTYTRADGWSSVTVDVSGYTQEDLDAAFASGYSAGLRDCSGYTPGNATAITLNVASAITDSGQASVTVSPAGSSADITYTSSDTSIATVDSAGTITVLSSGTVTICATDANTQLQDCKTIIVTKTIPVPGDVLVGMYYVSSTTAATEILNPHYGTTGLTKMEYPYGYERPLATSFVFPTSGVQTIYFYPKRSQYVGQGYNFQNVKALIGAEMNSGVTEIFSATFANTSLYSVIIPSGAEIDRMAFKSTPLTSVTINEGLTTIGEECFADCKSLSSITLPSTLTVLPTSCFSGCTALSNITFNGNMTTFSANCFAYCTSLRNFVVPASVTGIGASCFEGDEDIESITFLRSTPAPLGDNATSLGSVAYTFPIYVPSQSVNAYKAEYLNYASRIQANPNE